MKVMPGSGLVVFVLLFFAGAGICTAESVHLDPSWDIMNRARISYERGELGNALALCEDARTLHEKTINGYVQKLNTAITSAVLQESGGDILSVRKILAERNEADAVSIIDMVLGIHTEDFFNTSIDDLIVWLKKRSAYPDADILSGDVYAAEGEYALAREFYLKAWQQHEFLKYPQDRFSLCYRLADIARIRGNYGEQEQYLLLVITEDPVFGTPGQESSSLLAMKRTLENAIDTEKFFSLYRHKNRFALKAYQDLTEFYYFRSGKRFAPAFSTAILASVISVTILDDFLAQKLVDYEFSSFEDILKRTAMFPDILKQAEKLGLWGSFIDLAIILDDSGITDPARSLLNALASECPEKTISLKAQGLLKKID